MPLPRHQRRHVPAVLGDLLDQAGPQEGIERVGGHEQRLDLGETVVHLRHLHLVLEVADRAQALHDRGDATRAAEINQQPGELVHADVGQVGRHFPQHREPLLDGEQPFLRQVRADHHKYLVVEPGCPADDVKMPVGHGVERAWADDTAHAVTPFPYDASAAARPYQKVASPYRRAHPGRFPPAPPPPPPPPEHPPTTPPPRFDPPPPPLPHPHSPHTAPSAAP